MKPTIWSPEGFPERPTCHDVEGKRAVWLPPRDKALDEAPAHGGRHQIYHARTCSACGSIHPADLMQIRTASLVLSSEMPQDQPHCFFWDTGDKSGPFGKFFTTHLKDIGYTDEAFDSLCLWIYRRTSFRVGFGRKPDGGIWYKCS